MVFLACMHLVLFLALFLSPDCDHTVLVWIINYVKSSRDIGKYHLLSLRLLSQNPITANIEAWFDLSFQLNSNLHDSDWCSGLIVQVLWWRSTLAIHRPSPCSVWALQTQLVDESSLCEQYCPFQWSGWICSHFLYPLLTPRKIVSNSQKHHCLAFYRLWPTSVRSYRRLSVSKVMLKHN